MSRQSKLRNRVLSEMTAGCRQARESTLISKRASSASIHQVLYWAQFGVTFLLLAASVCAAMMLLY